MAATRSANLPFYLCPRAPAFDALRSRFEMTSVYVEREARWGRVGPAFFRRRAPAQGARTQSRPVYAPAQGALPFALRDDSRVRVEREAR